MAKRHKKDTDEDVKVKGKKKSKDKDKVRGKPASPQDTKGASKTHDEERQKKKPVEGKKLEGIGNYEFAVIEMVADEGKKPKKALVRMVPDKKAGRYIGYLENRNILGKDRESVKFQSDQIVARIGDNPRNGSVYGVQVEPLTDVWVIKGIGTAYIHREMLAGEKEDILWGLGSWLKWAKKNNLHGKVDLDIEIRPQRGRFAGTYNYTGNDEKRDSVILRPNSFSKGEGYLSYIVHHEMAHHYWYRWMTAAQKAEWVQLFDKHNKLSVISKDRAKKLITKLGKSKDTVREYLKEQDEKTKEDLEIILGHIGGTRGLNMEHLDWLRLRGVDIVKYLPGADLETGENEEFVSDYASTEVEELFAEAWSMFFTNFKVHPEAAKLVQKTFRQLKLQAIRPEKGKKDEEE